MPDCVAYNAGPFAAFLARNPLILFGIVLLTVVASWMAALLKVLVLFSPLFKETLVVSIDS